MASSASSRFTGEQAELLKSLARERDATAEAQLADGDLVVDAAVDVVDEGRLRKLIEPRLPEVDLPELLIEVDGWTGFADHLTPLSGNRRRSADMPCVLYAAILAPGTSSFYAPQPARRAAWWRRSSTSATSSTRSGRGAA